MHKTISYIFLPLTIYLLITGCFAFGERERTIAGKYRLVQWEDGTTYSLHAEGQDKPGGGVLGGTVKRIGWNERYIIAWRFSNFRGDPDGWMIIDHQQSKMTGPFSDGGIAKRPELAGIVAMDPAEAWEKLR
jgi:hypothetical protein